MAELIEVIEFTLDGVQMKVPRFKYLMCPRAICPRSLERLKASLEYYWYIRNQDEDLLMWVYRTASWDSESAKHTADLVEWILQEKLSNQPELAEKIAEVYGETRSLGGDSSDWEVMKKLTRLGLENCDLTKKVGFLVHCDGRKSDDHDYRTDYRFMKMMHPNYITDDSIKVLKDRLGYYRDLIKEDLLEVMHRDVRDWDCLPDSRSALFDLAKWIIEEKLTNRPELLKDIADDYGTDPRAEHRLREIAPQLGRG